MADNKSSNNPPQDQDPRRQKIVKIRLNFSWLYILFFLGLFYFLYHERGASPQKVEWAEVKEMVSAGDVKEIHYVRNDYKGTVTIRNRPDRRHTICAYP